MREIKFRAYIGLENNIKDVITIDFDNKSIGVLDVNLMGHPFIKIWDFDQVELMQYTGLKDKNGADIYEGDILELINEADRRVNAICKFGERRLIHGGYTIEIQGLYFEVEGRKTNPVICNYKGLHDLEIMEVRGNIYEKPELLEVERC